MKTKILLAYIFEFFRDGFYVGIFLLLPFIVKDIHLNLLQAGSLQSAINILYLLLAIPIVTLLFRYGEIRILLISILLYALGFIGFFYVNSYISLLLIFLIFGVSFSFYSIISNHIRATWFDKETRGKDLGNLMAVGDVGKVIFSSLTAFFAVLIGWRYISLTIGIIAAITFFIFSILLRKTYLPKTDEIDNKFKPKYSYFLKQKLFVFALLAGSLDEGINTPLYAFLPFLLLHKGVSPIYVGFVAGFYYFGNIISRLIFGRLVDRIGDAKVLIILEIIMSILIFSIASFSSITTVGIIAFILGIITEGTDPATYSMTAHSLEKIEQPQKASGIKTIFNGISKIFFPFLIGLIATQMGIVWGFYILAIASLLPIIPAWLYLKEKTDLN